MNLLFNESPLQVLASLVMQAGLKRPFYSSNYMLDRSSRPKCGLGISGFTEHMKSGKTKRSHFGLSIRLKERFVN
ncbi:hypothetical protein [Sporosarcina sp. FSL K6-5500]|uniref:hypothetical protein n=1 Tax=Sporosarcina sp. FSL K6-5500 TaxID=2921558 RepID=UPI0030FA6874